MTSLVRRVVFFCIIAILHLPSSILGSGTSAPPANVEFVPIPQGCALAKHPMLPVLYVGCYGFPEQKNLITFGLGADGAIATNTMRVFADYFSVDGKKPEFMYRIVPRPMVMTNENVLVLACSPDAPVPYYAQTNNHECAVLALDDYGQPSRLVRAFRTSYTSREQLMAARADPATRRLYLAYYVYFGWCELGGDGAPVSSQFNPIPCPINQWYWSYIPDWQRFFIMPPSPNVNIFKLSPDGRSLETLQTIATPPGSPLAGCLEVSRALRKIYVLSSSPQQELTVYALNGEGRLIGLPRYYSLGWPSLVRFDFKAKKLYAMTREWLRVFTLDGSGYPTGQPTLHTLSCGEIRDALVDETTGKLYIAATDPPKK